MRRFLLPSLHIQGRDFYKRQSWEINSEEFIFSTCWSHKNKTQQQPDKSTNMSHFALIYSDFVSESAPIYLSSCKGSCAFSATHSETSCSPIKHLCFDTVQNFSREEKRLQFGNSLICVKQTVSCARLRCLVALQLWDRWSQPLTGKIMLLISPGLWCSYFLIV